MWRRLIKRKNVCEVMVFPMTLQCSVYRDRGSRGQTLIFCGSSHFAGKRGTDLQEEVRRVAVPVGHPLDDLDPVVHALQHTGVQPVPGAGQDSFEVRGQPLGEASQGLNAAAGGHVVPFLPSVSGGGLVVGKPQGLELVLEQIRRGQ